MTPVHKVSRSDLHGDNRLHTTFSHDPAMNIADQLAEMIKNESFQQRADFNLIGKIDGGKHNSSYSANSMIRFNLCAAKSNRVPLATAKSTTLSGAAKGGAAPRTPKEAQSLLKTAAGGSDVVASAMFLNKPDLSVSQDRVSRDHLCKLNAILEGKSRIGI